MDMTAHERSERRQHHTCIHGKVFARNTHNSDDFMVVLRRNGPNYYLV